ncbi:MFS transporter [Nocardioides sp. BGMRC 2183]|nr:MFS transporter [Nocardioides sp. BGMRC 2183]
MITGLLVVFMLINFGDKAVLGLAADPMMEDLDISASQYGAVASAFYALFSISAIVVGFLANRRSNKRILLVLAVIWSVTQVPIIFFAGLATLFASRVVLGAAEGPANPLAVNAAQKWFPDHRRNLPTSLINLGAALGVVTLAPVLSYLIDNHGWRSAFVLMMVLGFAWSVLWAIFGREGDADAAARQSVAEADETGASGEQLVVEAGRAPYRKVFLSGTGIAVLVAGFAAYWGLALLVAWLPVYLSKALDLGTTTGGTLVVLPWLAGAIVIPLQGFISDRWMRRGVSSRVARVLLSATCLTIAAVCLAGLAVVPGTGAKLALLTIGLSIGTVQIGIGMTLIAEITPLAQRAAALATTTAVIGLSGIVAPALTGRMIDAAGESDPAGYHHAFLLTAVLMVIGAVTLVLLGRPLRDAARIAELSRAA